MQKTVPPSPYEETFGRQAGPGRPRGEGGLRSGDKAITEQARRRAKRVLMERHAQEFERLFKQEIKYIETVGLENVRG